MNIRFAVSFVTLFTAFLGVSRPAFSEEDSLDRDYAAELPRIPPKTPQEALKAFEIVPGFKVQLVTAEPLTRDPIALCFDEKSRMYVLEMPGYSEDRDSILGAVKRLEDKDGDGFFETSVTYVDNLAWPTGLGYANGTVYIGQAPDLIACRDTNDDGVADTREVIYTGFSMSNVQGMLNSFQWGIDNRLHGSAATNGGTVTAPNNPDFTAVNLSGRTFAIDPLNQHLTPRSGGGQYGMSFDPWGRRYITYNNDHALHTLYEDYYVSRNPYLNAPSPRVSITAEGAQAPQYRLSSIEPWRLVRTRLRVAGLVPGPIEGGGTPSGYVTGASGITVYKGDAWPREFVGQIFTGETNGNLIIRNRVEEDGITLVSYRVEQNTEFLRSSDNWFRPCFTLNGPDGALYIADMYRETIEHPLSLPPIIKKHLDLTSGRELGRIYRVVPVDYEQKAWPDLSKASTEELVALLDHDNGWHRENAARLLYERQDASAVPHLDRILANNPKPLTMVYTLYALQGLGAVKPAQISQALTNSDWHVRDNALRLAEPLLDADDALFAAVALCASDEHPRIRLQAAFSLGASQRPERLDALETLLKSNTDIPLIKTAVMSSLGTDASALLALMLEHSDATARFQLTPVLEELATFAAALDSPEQLEAVVAHLDDLQKQDPTLGGRLSRGLFSGLKTAGKGAAAQRLAEKNTSVRSLLASVLESSRATAADDKQEANKRIAAISDLTFGDYAESGPVLAAILEKEDNTSILQAVINALGAYNEPEVADRILNRWSSYTPASRNEALEVLFARPVFIDRLLFAMENGALAKTVLDAIRADQLLRHSDDGIRTRAEALIQARGAVSDEDLAKQLEQVLSLTGDATQGRKLFTDNCAQCHSFNGEGHVVAPDLASVLQGGNEKIVTNILDPNREVNAGYANFIVETTDWETHTGIIAGENATSITLRRANGEEDSLLRVNIESIQSTDMTIMPEGWIDTIGAQGIADVLQYLTTTKL